MRKFFGPMGSVSRVTIESQALKSNMLGDPSVRVVDVYVPAGHDGQGLPLLVDLVGFTGSGLSQTNWGGFRENLPERLDRLIVVLSWSRATRDLLKSFGWGIRALHQLDAATMVPSPRRLPHTISWSRL